MRSQPHPGCYQTCYGDNVDHLLHAALLHWPPLPCLISFFIPQASVPRQKKAESPLPHDSSSPRCITAKDMGILHHSKYLIASLSPESLTQSCFKSLTGACYATWTKATNPIVLYCSRQNLSPTALKQLWNVPPTPMGDITPHKTFCASTGCSSAEPSE